MVKHQYAWDTEIIKVSDINKLSDKNYKDETKKFWLKKLSEGSRGN